MMLIKLIGRRREDEEFLSIPDRDKPIVQQAILNLG